MVLCLDISDISQGHMKEVGLSISVNLCTVNTHFGCTYSLSV